MKKSSKIRMIAVTIFAAILVLLPISVTAQEIGFNKIEKIALKVFSLKSNRSASSLKISKAIPIYSNNEVAYYIFNFEPSGHIIVSTNKAFEPILGYGLNSTIDFDSIPLGLKFLLDNYKNEISQTKKQGLIISKETSSKWENYINLDINASLQSYSTGTYLLQTTWAQDNGYNRFCPLDPITNLRTIVGCGGVALGQILYYWQCRVFPDNSITYTPARFLSPLTVNFFGQNYNWSSMSKTSSDDYNALMLYHSAASIRADFGSASTTNFATNTRTALVTYFGFNANNIQNKDSYTNATWINMLKTEINAERPIYYSGYNYSGSYGHAWVIDGYNSSDFFHCNWGWSGNYNGWYSLSALNPSSYSLNDGQSAILNVYPMLDACSGLNGSSDICTGNYTYSISIPTSASVVWSKSGNLTQVGGNTGTSYTVHSTTAQSGTGSITATIYNSQNQVFKTRTKDVWTGPHASINGIETMLKGRTRTYTLNVISGQPITSFNWSADGGVIPVGSTTSSSFTVKGTGCGSGTVSCTYGNSCGTGDEQLDIEVICETLSMLLSPNPTSDLININLVTAFDKTAVIDDNNLLAESYTTKQENNQYEGEFEIQVWNEYSGLITKIKDKNKPNLQISLKNKPRGMYYFHLIVNGVVVKKKTIILKD